MNLLDLVRRERRPAPWTEGDNIPWNEPGFSRRMLKEHLSQEHDAASRRFAIIDEQVAWIDRQVLGGRPSRVLDLGCGPGLYTSRLARLGHTCRGIDFSPASVEYANAQATPGTEYCLGDVRTTEFGAGYDLVMMLYGEFNVFRPEHSADLLRRAKAALQPGGQLLLEVSTPESIEALGKEPRSWGAYESGLFADTPYLYLVEAFWHEAESAATERHWVVDGATGAVQRWATSYAAYTAERLTALLEQAGFERPELIGTEVATAPVQNGFLFVRASAAR